MLLLLLLLLVLLLLRSSLLLQMLLLQRYILRSMILIIIRIILLLLFRLAHQMRQLSRIRSRQLSGLCHFRNHRYTIQHCTIATATTDFDSGELYRVIVDRTHGTINWDCCCLDSWKS